MSDPLDLEELDLDIDHLELDLDQLPPDGNEEETGDEPTPSHPLGVVSFTSPNAAMSSLPNNVIGTIRTITPYLVGWILSGLIWLTGVLAAWVGVEFTIPGWLEGRLTDLLPIVLGTAYYLIARKWLEPRWPNIAWLGSKQQPFYEGANDAEILLPVAMLASAVDYVTYQGGRMSPAFRDSQLSVAEEVPGFRLTQGGRSTSVAASADTHARDAADYSVKGKTEAEVARFITAQRRRGNFASFRTTRTKKWGVRAQGFSSYHIHVVGNGWGDMSPGAIQQAIAYRKGRDGLRGNGPDAGGPGHTRVYTSTTWPSYRKAQLGSKPAPAPKPGVDKSKSIPRVYTPKPWPALTVDGILGPKTLNRLRMQLSVAVTGKAGLTHYDVAALKVWLGGIYDGSGILSTLDVHRLQSRVGVPQTGKLDKPTILSLQRYLNKYR